MTTPEQIKMWIEAGLAGAIVEAVGDGHHFEATVVSAAFAGKNKLARHRMIYTILGQKMQTQIHALSLRTFTPEEKKK